MRNSQPEQLGGFARLDVSRIIGEAKQICEQFLYSLEKHYIFISLFNTREMSYWTPEILIPKIQQVFVQKLHFLSEFDHRFLLFTCFLIHNTFSAMKFPFFLTSTTIRTWLYHLDMFHTLLLLTVVKHIWQSPQQPFEACTRYDVWVHVNSSNSLGIDTHCFFVIPNLPVFDRGICDIDSNPNRSVCHK